MNYKKILLVSFIFLILFSVSANAVSFTLDDATGISNPITEDGINIFYTVEYNTYGEIHKYDTFQGSYSDGVYDIPQRVIDVYVYGDYYYYVTLNGIVYKTTLEDYYLQFDSSQDGNTITLSQPYTSDQYNSNILVDSNGDVFLHDGDKSIYFIDSSKRTSVLWYTNNVTMRTIFPTSDGEGISYTTLDGDEKQYLITDHTLNSATLIYSGTADTYNIGYRLTDGYLVGSVTTGGVLVLRQLYENKTLMGNITLGTAIGTGVNAEEIIVYNDGTILYTKIDSNALIAYFATFSTLDDIGGFSFYSGIDLVTPVNEYAESTISSEHDTYFNNSIIRTNYVIATETLSNSEQEYLKNTFDFKVELFNDDNNVLDSYYIYGNSLMVEEVSNDILDFFTNPILLIIGEEYLYKSGYKDYFNVNNWGNGTYTLKLYEVNKFTGRKALLNTDIFIIRNESYDGEIIIETPLDVPTSNKDMQSNAIQLISSPYFMGLIGLIVVAKSIGTDKLGKINADALIMGVIVGIIILVLIGLFPVWTIFVVVLFGLVLLGKRSNGGD